MNKLNILMLSPVPIYPNDAGDRVRVKGTAWGLAKHHDVTLIAPTTSEKNLHLDNSLPEGLTLHDIFVKETNLPNKLISLFSKLPYHTALRYNKETQRQVNQELSKTKFDLIYCHFLQTLPYVQKTELPIIFDQHNVDAVYWERQINQYKNPLLKLLARRNYKKTIKYEKKNLSRIKGIVSVSIEDSRVTQNYAGEDVNNFFVVQNGVDIGKYDFKFKKRIANKLVLGFFGSMDLAYNEDAANYLIDKILPLVYNKLSDIELAVLIIGRNPSKRLRKKVGLSKYNIELTGTVKSVNEHLAKVDLMILPLNSGAGTKLRVIESMATGVPVIGSPLALVGLQEYVESGHLVLAENLDEYVDKICKLSLDHSVLKTIQLKARALVEQSFSWDNTTMNLANELATII